MVFSQCICCTKWNLIMLVFIISVISTAGPPSNTKWKGQQSDYTRMMPVDAEWDALKSLKAWRTDKSNTKNTGLQGSTVQTHSDSFTHQNLPHTLQTCSPIKRQARLPVYYWACVRTVSALCCPSDCRRWSIPGFQKDGDKIG